MSLAVCLEHSRTLRAKTEILDRRIERRTNTDTERQTLILRSEIFCNQLLNGRRLKQNNFSQMKMAENGVYVRFFKQELEVCCCSNFIVRAFTLNSQMVSKMD